MINAAQLHPTRRKLAQSGLGLVSAMVGMFLALTMSAIAVSLLGKALKGPTGSELDNTTDNLRKHIQLWRETALGTGANPNNTAGIDTIKACQLSGSPLKCSPYNGGTGSQCFVHLSQNLPFNGPELLIRAFRLNNGQLQYYAGQSNDSSWNQHKQLCEQNTGWTAMNDTRVYIIQSLRVCTANVTSLTQANQDYETSCVSVLDANPVKNRAWLLLFDTQQVKSPDLKDQIHGWLGFQNSTRVTSIQ